MADIATSAAGPPLSRCNTLFGKVAFASAAFALASVTAAWIVDLDPIAWIRDPTFAKGVNGQSFDDRFGSGPVLNSESIKSLSRSIVRSVRSDFETEFQQIEDLLIGQLRDGQVGRRSGQTTPSVIAIPLPRSRPVEANLQSKVDPSSTQSDSRTLLQKLADLMPPRRMLASLTPGDGLFGGGPDIVALGYDNFTAVYDISAHAVYMPNGTRLEAHSGLGSLMDDPGHVDERNVGATPPNVYDLKPRERPFHGVEALRMIPQGDNDNHGRSGLLAHSYMLGANGDSNGCVSIKDYGKFLKAFKSGEIKRLIVVPSLGESLSVGHSNSSS